MKRIKAIWILLLLSSTLWISAKDYNASLFGIKSDGITLNTGSIQKAIDFISENGGGRLLFYVGRYLTGTISLKSNVTIQLQEGAILAASGSIYDYDAANGIPALIVAENQENIAITGKGVIEGRGAALRENISDQIGKGYLPETAAQSSPALIAMSRCAQVTVERIILRDACGDVQVYSGCKNININNITVESKAVPGSKGMVISSCDGVTLSHSYFDTTGTEIETNRASENVSVRETVNSKGKKL